MVKVGKLLKKIIKWETKHMRPKIFRLSPVVEKLYLPIYGFCLFKHFSNV